MSLISKITVEIAGKKVELTKSQAMELYNELHSMFGYNAPPHYIIQQQPWIPMVPTCETITTADTIDAFAHING